MDKGGRKLNLGISRQEIAHSFGTHSVDTMESSYLIPEKSTRAIDAFNLIREGHDTMGLNEKQEVNHFKKHQQLLKEIRNQPKL